MKIQKRKTLKYFYLQYPYKTRDVTSTTVPVPYFPKDQITDHQYSITYKEFKEIINIYSKYAIDYLKGGDKLVMPYEIGEIQLRKAKGGGINWVASEKGNMKKYRNLHLGNKRFLVKWFRRKERLSFKWIWRVRLTKKAWSVINDSYNSNPILFNNLTNA